jgi:hypothetical protein
MDVEEWRGLAGVRAGSFGGGRRLELRHLNFGVFGFAPFSFEF